MTVRNSPNAIARFLGDPTGYLFNNTDIDKTGRVLAVGANNQTVVIDTTQAYVIEPFRTTA